MEGFDLSGEVSQGRVGLGHRVLKRREERGIECVEPVGVEVFEMAVAAAAAAFLPAKETCNQDLINRLGL